MSSYYGSEVIDAMLPGEKPHKLQIVRIILNKHRWLNLGNTKALERTRVED